MQKGCGRAFLKSGSHFLLTSAWDYTAVVTSASKRSGLGISLMIIELVPPTRLSFSHLFPPVGGLKCAI